jgi:hypothetical protein
MRPAVAREKVEKSWYCQSPLEHKCKDVCLFIFSRSLSVWKHCIAWILTVIFLLLVWVASLCFINLHFRLLGQGYSLESIGNATMEADAISRERMASANKQHMDRISEVSERFGRVLKKALGMTLPTQTTVASSSA